jgi:bacillithiol biosynthesis cysteine-adding enzyme BshC
MQSKATRLPYEQTGYFSKIVLDYLNGEKKLKPFYVHEVSVKGMRDAIKERKAFNTNRELLENRIRARYAGMELPEKLRANIDRLLSPDTFTITTAHQPNIFTGHLYFIYKILHAVKLADELGKLIPENKFVPVFYMGSEDADLEELGQFHLFGEKYEWKTDQKGAVGRMKVDKALLELVEKMSGQLLVLEEGEKLIILIKECYQLGDAIERATFKLIHTLFGEYGLIVLLPDDAELKRQFVPLMKKELEENFSYHAVQSTVNEFPKEYKVQASGREVNLFYLKDDRRERIMARGERQEGKGEEINEELEEHPERFSPNVILRPVFQEMILPNVAFIGGGGELAYWLELKKVFKAAAVPFPVLVLRNSFMIVEDSQQSLLDKLKFSLTDIFKSEKELMNDLVKRDSKISLTLDPEKLAIERSFEEAKKAAANIDISLVKHVDALKSKALKKIEALEKKMLKAERKKFIAQQRQLQKLRSQLFMNNSLQERVENFMPYYAKYGPVFFDKLYEASLSLEQDFTLLGLSSVPPSH